MAPLVFSLDLTEENDPRHALVNFCVALQSAANAANRKVEGRVVFDDTETIEGRVVAVTHIHMVEAYPSDLGDGRVVDTGHLILSLTLRILSLTLRLAERL